MGHTITLAALCTVAFTNDSTLRQWPFALTLADMASGAAATAVAAVAVRSVVR